MSLKFVTKSPIENQASIDSGNGLAPNSRQAMTWTNYDPVHQRIYAVLWDELIPITVRKQEPPGWLQMNPYFFPLNAMMQSYQPDLMQ